MGLGGIGQRHLRNLRKLGGNDLEIMAYDPRPNPPVLTDQLKVEEGALYPALHRLELRGLLKASWGASENNRRAKFYDLTAEGRKRLNAESQRWARLSAAVAFVMQAS